MKASPNPSEGEEKEPECVDMSFELIIERINVQNFHCQTPFSFGEGLGMRL